MTAELIVGERGSEDGGILGGVIIYDTEEQAAEVWNRRAEYG